MICFSFSCSDSQRVAAVNKTIDQVLQHSAYLAKDVMYDRLTSSWLSKPDSLAISGLVIDHFENGVISKVINVSSGRQQGPQITYYPNGKIKFYEMFSDGKLDGLVERWSMQHGYKLISQLHYREGKLHGKQKKWYSSGELHKVLNMEMGVESGMQKAFRKNGVLYANYEAKNGRTFGLQRSNLCYELQNEEIVYQQ